MSIVKALDICNEIIIVGHVNEDQLNLSNNYLSDVLLVTDLPNVIRQPSTVTGNSYIRYDPITVTINYAILDSGGLNVPYYISDHKATNILFLY